MDLCLLILLLVLYCWAHQQDSLTRIVRQFCSYTVDSVVTDIEEQVCDQRHMLIADHKYRRAKFAHPGKNDLFKGLPTPCPRLKKSFFSMPKACPASKISYSLCLLGAFCVTFQGAQHAQDPESIAF